MTKEDAPALIREVPKPLHLVQEQFAQGLGAYLSAGKSPASTVNRCKHGKRLPLPFLVQRLLAIKQEREQGESKRPKGKTSR